MSKSPITCHVLDSSIGRPAAGVEVLLEHQADGSNFKELATGVTNCDGRCMSLFPASGKQEDAALVAGRLYKVTFKTKPYFEGSGRKTFYPWVEITFEVPAPDEHYHIPLLISPYSYTTYRGS
ncbi:Hydroxyisourate hydrolase [Gloeophyllum trabeum ATCC 11539]|uniref:5-hydroxyisourate hydrolase n=1 Tax=Gloeophyllum trabeum (strain ATCC 11539 / FP-39264 / Madison 617) TaxID=670483 RepID=S7QKN5_GLOTA|nr:Hydroxyisourate hydrolase [Gloeophyllum trabeum ATCC 11539]EPQ60351.1 Hydroxyisourate hydrolase [Gloeophyllum trabeum ATCC 11539]